MKTILIALFLLFSIACKKTNQTAGPVKMPFVNKAFLYLPHKEDYSILRQKLLNLKLTSLLKVENESTVSKGDEFNFLDDQYKLNDHDDSEYKKMKESCAEIIVSFKDHLEIYFVPTGISKDKALLQLGVKADIEDQLYWVGEGTDILWKGHSYYLLSSNTAEIKNNDIHFYQAKSEVKNFNQASFNLKNNQQVIFNFKANSFMNQTSINLLGGSARPCRSGNREAGIECGGCGYRIEDLTSGTIQVETPQAELNLSVRINGLEYSMQTFEIKEIRDGFLSVMIDLKKFSLTEDVVIEVLPFKTQPLIKTFNGFDYSSSCINKNVSIQRDMGYRLNVDLEMETKGRALKL